MEYLTNNDKEFVFVLITKHPVLAVGMKGNDVSKTFGSFRCVLSQKSNALANVILTSALGSVYWAHSVVNKMYSKKYVDHYV